MSSLSYADVVHAVRAVEALVQNTRQALAQAEEQLAQAQAQLQQTIPVRHQHWQLAPHVKSVQYSPYSMVRRFAHNKFRLTVLAGK